MIARRGGFRRTTDFYLLVFLHYFLQTHLPVTLFGAMSATVGRHLHFRQKDHSNYAARFSGCAVPRSRSVVACAGAGAVGGLPIYVPATQYFLCGDCSSARRVGSSRRNLSDSSFVAVAAHGEFAVPSGLAADRDRSGGRAHPH